MKKQSFALLSILFLVSLLSWYNFLFGFKFTGKTSSRSKLIVDPNGSLEVHFCHSENCENILANLAEGSYVRCALYSLDSELLCKAFNPLASRVLVNKRSKCGKVEKLDTEYLMHNKFCIFNLTYVTTGSFNPVKRNLKDFNDLLIIRSKPIVKAFNDEFLELSNKTFGSGDLSYANDFLLNDTFVSVYFCPEDECEKAVIDELMKTDKEVYFMVYLITNKRLSETLAKLKNSGAKITGIVENTKARATKFFYLQKHGIKVKKDPCPGKLLHLKVFIIDNSTVITGSANPTYSGYHRNDENLIIIRNRKIAEAYMEVFEDIWNNRTCMS